MTRESSPTLRCAPCQLDCKLKYDGGCKQENGGLEVWPFRVELLSVRTQWLSVNGICVIIMHYFVHFIDIFI